MLAKDAKKRLLEAEGVFETDKEGACYLGHLEKKQRHAMSVSRLTESGLSNLHLNFGCTEAMVLEGSTGEGDSERSGPFFVSFDPLLDLPDSTTEICNRNGGGRFDDLTFRARTLTSDEKQQSSSASINGHKLCWDTKGYSAVVHLLNANYLKARVQADAEDSLKSMDEVSLHPSTLFISS